MSSPKRHIFISLFFILKCFSKPLIIIVIIILLLLLIFLLLFDLVHSIADGFKLIGSGWNKLRPNPSDLAYSDKHSSEFFLMQ